MSLQPVSMLMSNLNLDSAAKISPNALSAAQDTGQSQEIIREGIRAVQSVQASDAAAQAQRVHRKTSGEDQDGHGRHSRQNQDTHDSFVHTASKNDEHAVKPENAPLLRENERSPKRRVEFLA